MTWAFHRESESLGQDMPPLSNTRTSKWRVGTPILFSLLVIRRESVSIHPSEGCASTCYLYPNPSCLSGTFYSSLYSIFSLFSVGSLLTSFKVFWSNQFRMHIPGSVSSSAYHLLPPIHSYPLHPSSQLHSSLTPTHISQLWPPYQGHWGLSWLGLTPFLDLDILWFF